MKNIYNEILFDFQKDVVDDSHNSKSYGLFLEMGLGKTFTTLSIIQERKKNKVLVLCPTSKVLEWEEDLKNHLGLDTYVLNGSVKKDKKTLDEFEQGAIVVNYQRAWRRDIIDILDDDFIIVADESHYLKHRTSKIGKWSTKIKNKVSGILLLTGTPISNGDVRQWYNQLILLGWDFKYSAFENEFAITELVSMNGNKWKNYIGAKNLKTLHENIKKRATFLKTEDVKNQLPKQSIIDVNLTHDKKRTYNLVKKEKIYKDIISIETAGTLFLRLRQLASNFIENEVNIGSHKKVALKELLESNENNMLVFYNFNEELEQIKSVCEKLDINVYELNGHTKNIDKIKDNKQYIIAGQYMSASSGWNGQFLHNTIYYSPPLSSADYEQSLKRTNRIGQKEHCTYYRFITKGTIEKDIYNTLASGVDYTLKVFKDGKK